MKELPREVVEGRAKLLAKEFLSNADIKELVLSLRVRSLSQFLHTVWPWQSFLECFQLCGNLLRVCF